MSTEKKARALRNTAKDAGLDGIARVELTVEDAQEIAGALLTVLHEVKGIDWRPEWLRKVVDDQ